MPCNRAIDCGARLRQVMKLLTLKCTFACVGAVHRHVWPVSFTDLIMLLSAIAVATWEDTDVRR